MLIARTHPLQETAAQRLSIPSGQPQEHRRPRDTMWTEQTVVMYLGYFYISTIKEKESLGGIWEGLGGRKERLRK